MLTIEKYKIINIFLEGIPKIPYADGVGGFRGICLHATANFGSGEEEDTAVSERNYEQNNWNTAFVHYFCDYSSILDVADDNYISYGCSGGNPYFISIELDQTHRDDRFIESYDRWVWLTARILHKHKLGVIDGVTLVSHRWVSQHYSGTHDDPHAYIESHGKNWANVVQDVSSYYNQFILEENQINGDDENMPMKIDDWAWVELDKYVSMAYNDGSITTWAWVDKTRARQLTLTEATLLKILIDERRRTKALGIQQ